MTSSYVSARFEKTDLSATVGKQRCIVRNLDDGSVPPSPSTGYFPTQPDELRNFLVIEYVNDSIGERLASIATLPDISTYTVRALTGFEISGGADFVTAGVAPGDILEITLPVPERWQSEEYPSSPFQLSVASVVSSTRLTLTGPIPSFLSNLTWSITGKASGVGTGFPRREGFPATGSTFLDQRMNLLFNTVAELDTFVEATKESLDLLTNTSTSSTLVSENYTSS